MNNRRKFLKKAAIGSAAIAGLSGWSSLEAAGGASSACDTNMPEGAQKGESVANTGWTAAFDEAASTVVLQNGQITLSGKLSFTSGGAQWTVARSRDGVADRYALVDTQGDVQGYFVLITDGEQLKLLFYHRTAQNYAGVLSFTGKIGFLEDSFPCRTVPLAGERVLPLSCGRTDSVLNDSLFSPSGDLALQIEAARLSLATESGGAYLFSMQGRIEEPSEAEWTFRVERNYFKSRYVPYYHPIDRKRCPKTPTGWMSWNTYFDKATAADNLNEAKIGQKYLQPFGCEFWSIESWQGNSDHLPVSDFYNMNLEVNQKQFPKGMKKLADDIRALGFRPGLWVPPFGTGNHEFYKAHRDWFLHYKDGTPIRSWNGQYTLDPTVVEAREHLKKMFDIASHQWGYEFFKIDGMSGRNHSLSAHLYERPEVRACFKDPSCPNPFELCIKAFREGIGDDRVFLACQGHTSGAEALYADAARLGADIVHPNEPVKWSNVLNQGRCLINQVFTHNIVLTADPDTLLVHDLPTEEARTSATIVALPGQLTFFGDKLAGLSEQQFKILQQTLPVPNVLPVNLYPVFSMLPVWNLRVRHEYLGNYNVIALFNWEDHAQPVLATAEELGMDTGKDYIGYEFWTEQAIGIERLEASWRLSVEVPAHGVRVVALHEKANRPQWAGSDRHITQTAMEINEWIYSEDHDISGNIRLTGSFPLAMRLNIPQGWKFSQVICKDAACTAKEEPGNLLALNFLAQKTTNAQFNISFHNG
jgi:hypothetical protein